MLSNTLNTNEIKDSTGTEVEFTRRSISDMSTEFTKVGETPALKHRFSIKHQEIGAGFTSRRRGVIRFDYTVVSDVDNATPVTAAAYLVLDNPIGAVLTQDAAKMVLANLQSFISTTGAATAVLFDGTGNGASALLNASL